MKSVVFSVGYRTSDREWLEKAIQQVHQDFFSAKRRNLRIADISSVGPDGEAFKKQQDFTNRDELMLLWDESPFGHPYPHELRTAIDYFRKGWEANSTKSL